MLFICGNHTFGKKKPCKTCKKFLLWGISTGYCFKNKKNVSCRSHCKFYKRDSKLWTKNGKCKIDEYLLYA